MKNKDEILKTIAELKSMDIDMYLFYLEDLIRNNETIGEEVSDQMYYYSDLFDILGKHLKEIDL